nr:GRB2-associated-binding protein 1-like isoform X2 [Gasterosteus aculeatus aculeatus]
MSGPGEVVCEGWLRKSPPEKKLRRHAWKRRWFVLRSGRLSGEPDVLQYFKSQQTRRPIRTINLSLCEQVDAGLSFTKKELESSFVFHLRTEERTWYLVAESEEDMNRWVSSISLLWGFNPTEDGPERHSVSGSSATAMAAATRSVPDPYDLPGAGSPTHGGDAEENYMWLSHCQSHIGPPLASTTSQESDSNSLRLPSSSSSSSSSARSGTPPSGQSPDAGVTSDLQRPPGRLRCHPSPHPRKHSLDFRLRPVAIPLSAAAPCAHPYAAGGYQVPRRESKTQSAPPSPLPRGLVFFCRGTPPPSRGSSPRAQTGQSGRPQPRGAAAQGGSAGGQRRATLPHCFPELERRDGCLEGGGLPRSNTVTSPGGDAVYAPRSLSHRASMFDFSERFNSYFLNKGLVPLGSVCSEDDDVDENYVPMSAAATEPPVAPRVPPPPPSDPCVHLREANYVPMTPLAPPPPAHPTPATGDPPSLGKRVPPPAHAGFRSHPLTPAAPLTPPPLRRAAAESPGGGGGEATPPPIHRDLKPQRRGKPAPLDISPMQQEWQEVPPPVRSPVTRTFTRDPSSCRPVRPTSAHSSSPSSDSEDGDDSCVAMTTTTTTSTLSFSRRRVVSEAPAAPGLRRWSQQPDAPARHRRQTGGVPGPGPGPPHRAIDGNQTETPHGRRRRRRRRRRAGGGGRGARARGLRGGGPQENQGPEEHQRSVARWEDVHGEREMPELTAADSTGPAEVSDLPSRVTRPTADVINF